MSKYLFDRLKLLEAKHPSPVKAESGSRHLRVFYGWSKLNKQQRREAIDVAFENMEGAGSDGRRFVRTLRKTMDVVASRDQTPQECLMASRSCRAFTVYHVFLDQKGIDGSLRRALLVNRKDDDGKGIPDETLESISRALEEHFLETHPSYSEPDLPAPIPFKD